MTQINTLKHNIVDKNNQFGTKIEDLKNDFSSWTTKDVEIKIKSEKLSTDNVFYNLSSSINKQSNDATDYIANFYNNYHADKHKHIKSFITKILNDSLKINTKTNKLNLLESILTTNPYQYKDDLIYQKDDFERMSEGKKLL